MADRTGAKGIVSRSAAADWDEHANFALATCCKRYECAFRLAVQRKPSEGDQDYNGGD